MISAGAPVPELTDMLKPFIDARPADVRYVLDQLLGGAIADLTPLIDRERIGDFANKKFDDLNAQVGMTAFVSGAPVARTSGTGLPE